MLPRRKFLRRSSACAGAAAAIPGAGRSANGPLRDTRLAPSARSSTARPAAQWSIACWMRPVSACRSASGGRAPCGAESRAWSTTQEAGMFGRVTCRKSCAG